MNKNKYAIVSVYDKSGLEKLVKELISHGYRVISTSGTRKYLLEKGIEVTEVSSLTGFAEILEGRVKTLHPLIFGGILAQTEEELTKYSLPNIEVVVVNFYPFEEISKKPLSSDKLMEYIDIGGIALVRAAAKNYKRVCVLTSPEEYDEFISKLNSEIDEEYRKRLALKAFARTASYDIAIYNTLWNLWNKSMPEYFFLALPKHMDLRYGENPHQQASLYVESNFKWKQLSGKTLSFNNIYDVDSAYRIVCDLENTACAIVKHGNPCGVAEADSVREAFEKALDADRVSSYGGIIAFNRNVCKDVAELISSSFFEAIIAPSYDEDALSVLRKRKNLRIIQSPKLVYRGLDFKRVVGGVLVQQWDRNSSEDWMLVTKRDCTEDELENLRFAWKVVRYVKSNGIVLAKDRMTVGIGAGQMSRVDSVRIALIKARERSKDAVMASDGFFPFTDAIEIAARGGITAIVQPGGSKKDKEIVDKADEYGIAMYFTGYRVFRH